MPTRNVTIPLDAAKLALHHMPIPAEMRSDEVALYDAIEAAVNASDAAACEYNGDPASIPDYAAVALETMRHEGGFSPPGGGKIDKIKFIRVVTGLGLKEAKEATEDHPVIHNCSGSRARRILSTVLDGCTITGADVFRVARVEV